jgi:predicted DsbA family dithiol-disulfide isomerase
LRPKGGPPISPEYRQHIEQVGRPRFEAVAREMYGLRIQSGPFGIDSRPALVGAKFAEGQGVGQAYHDAVFRAYWQQGRSLEDRAVLLEVAGSVGLKPDAFSAALDDPAYLRAVLADIMEAQAIGLTGVPALIFAGQYLVSGAQPYEVLVQVVEKVREKIGYTGGQG